MRNFPVANLLLKYAFFLKLTIIPPLRCIKDHILTYYWSFQVCSGELHLRWRLFLDRAQNYHVRFSWIYQEMLVLNLIGSDNFTFILIWSHDVYLLTNLSIYPNILLSVFKVWWLLINVKNEWWIDEKWFVIGPYKSNHIPS